MNEPEGFPILFQYTNHFDWYAELDLSYTPTWIFYFKILTTLSYIPRGMEYSVLPMEYA